MTNYTATYSAEDNKLRLYASSRLDSETYARVKAAGFRWAPKQDLFVAPAWSPNREDLLIELAGGIEAEQTTLAERAEAKAERLEALSDKRRRESNSFSAAAARISERFAMGQPILVGHHSERRARKDKERADNSQRKAIEASKAVGYWLYKASAVQHHANRKNRDEVRVRRIKTLLADLRDLQRKLNHAALAVKILETITVEKLPALIGRRLKEGELFYWDAYDEFTRKVIPIEEIKERALNMHIATLEQPRLRRWIEHTLNRLSYERELLGEVPRYDGPITPVMLQEFAREHGADQPKGEQFSCENFTLKSPVPLPAHIADGCEVTLSADQWRDLMQSCGYEAKMKAEKKAARSKKTSACPLLNVKAEKLTALNPYYRDETIVYSVIEMTKADYAAINKDYKATRVSVCGQFKFRTCMKGHSLTAVFLTDSKAHSLPEVPAKDEATA